MSVATFFCTAQFLLVLVFYTFLGVAKIPESVDEGINDLVLHAIGYGLAVFSAYLLVQKLSRMWWMLALLWLFSLLIEIVQFYLPWRSLSMLDLMANGSGLLAGFILVALFRPIIDNIIRWLKLNCSSVEAVE